ncbi:odorant receptor 13a [Condylostylus longicornis]|uniref:odorant receptor 13a n=1 Tax=Condylostylus longicornis TaxID=2530218 RepID=UPI00244DF254|nr:odorant receptor 13a [Condylostylus longicornis]
MLFKPIPVQCPEKFSFPRQCIALKFNGSWPLDGKKDIFSILYLSLSWYIIFSVGLTIYFQFEYLVYIFGDIMKTTENCCTTFMGAMNFVRILHMRLYNNDLKELIDDFTHKIWIPTGKHKKIERHIEHNMIIFRGQSVLMILLISLYCTMPIVELLFLNSELDEKPFPYKMIFFYDAQKPIYRYVLTYIFTAMAGVAVVTTLFAEDSLFGYFVNHCCGQFQILGEEVAKVMPRGYENSLKKYGSNGLTEALVQREYNYELHKIAKRHSTLIEFCDKLDKFYSPIMLANFLISSVLICMVGFQIVTGKMFIGDLLKFIVYIISSCSQLFVLCWNSDALIQNSLEISWNFYSCNWEGGTFEIDEETPKQNLQRFYYPGGAIFNKKLTFMIMRSQKPCKITAMKFSVVSLQSFRAIMGTSMSYFTLLQSLIE